MKFSENPSIGSRVVLCGQTDRHVTKLIIAFRNFANLSKNYDLSTRRIFVFYVDPEKTNVTFLCNNN
jgi:hypothetical protein